MSNLIVAKHSKYEWERKQFNLSHDEIVSKYSAERANLNSILESHDKQLKVRNLCKDIIPESEFCMMDEVHNYLSDSAIVNFDWDLIIVIGGDNSFTYVSHWAAEIPLLGINSDPDRSVGCLTRFSIKEEQDIYDLVEAIDFQEFGIQSWPRIRTLVDNKYIVPPATSEYYFGERRRKNMSRHILVHKGKEYEQKCSGLIVSTGAGSTGWYKSSSKLNTWEPDSNIIRFIATEPYSGNHLFGELDENEELIIYSLNDGDGCVSCDGWEEADFKRGSEARIFRDAPLNVVVPLSKG